MQAVGENAVPEEGAASRLKLPHDELLIMLGLLCMLLALRPPRCLCQQIFAVLNCQLV